MSATQHWTEMIRAEHAQSESMRKEDPPLDSWSNFAQQFRADPNRLDDDLVNYLRQSIEPGSVVLDVGAGGGRLALPLALDADKVIAVEPSPSMCRVLREVAEEFQVSNIEVVESGWLDCDVPKADVVICVHVLYVIQDIELFIRKLEEHAERVIVVVYQAPPQSQIYPLWEMVHGVQRLPLPSLPELLEVLKQLGIKPDVQAIPTRGSRGFDSFALAKEQIARRLYLHEGTPEMERLGKILAQVLAEEDGVFTINDSILLEPHVVSWRPKISSRTYIETA